MSQSKPLLTLSLSASGAVSEYHLVKHSGAQATVLGEKVLGVNLFAASDNETIAVNAKGSVIVTLNDDVVPGDSLVTDATGKAVKATDEATQFVFGDALEAGSAGRKIEALMR